MDKPFLPTIPGTWLPLTADEGQRFLSRLDRHLQAAGLAAPAFSQQYPVQALHALPLSFYKGWVMVTVECRLGDGRLANVDTLLGPGFIWCVDGFASMLHAINAGRACRVEVPSPSGVPAVARPMASPLQALAPRSNGPDYLHFFCHALRTSAGCFRIVDDLDTLRLCGARGRLQTLAARLQPTRLGWLRHSDGRGQTKGQAGSVPPGVLTARTTLLYDGALIQAGFEITRQGEVRLTTQTELATDVAPPEANHRWWRNIRPATQPPTVP